MARVRFRSLVRTLAVAYAVLIVAAAGCGSSNNQAGHGVGGSGGHGGNSGVGGAAGSGVGGAGGATDAGGTSQQSGCQLPSGPAGSWVEVPAPPGQSGFHVTDAFTAGPNDLFFAGNTFDPTGGAPPTDARVLRWSQGCWTVEVMIPASASAPQFPSVHGTGPDDVWATGGDLLFHRDAQGWVRFADETWRGKIRPPPSFFGPVELRRVRAAAVNDAWVAASSNILHWSGGQWTTYNFDDPSYPNVSASIGYSFSDIWIDSPSNVWVGGPSDQVGNTMDLAFMHHFDGASWTHTLIRSFSLEAIWRGGAVLWLTGATLADINGQTQSLTLNRFDGTSSTPAPIAGVDSTQRSVFMTSLFGHGASDIWAAGEDVAHFDGQSWSLVADAPAAARSTIDSRNTYVAGDAGSVWLATPGPRFFRKVTGP